MKAARFHEYGDASVLRLDDVPDPNRGPARSSSACALSA